jgi:hypothetical protein
MGIRGRLILTPLLVGFIKEYALSSRLAIQAIKPRLPIQSTESMD